MRVDESRNSRSRLTANSHALSSTLSWFKFCWESMRGLARLTGHESCTRDVESCRSKRLFQVVTHKKKKKKRKYYYVLCQQFDKRQKTKKKKRGSKEQKQGNRKKTLVNSHATLTARLTEQWQLRKHSCKLSPANSHRLSSSFDPGFIVMLFVSCMFIPFWFWLVKLFNIMLCFSRFAFRELAPVFRGPCFRDLHPRVH